MGPHLFVHVADDIIGDWFRPVCSRTLLLQVVAGYPAGSRWGGPGVLFCLDFGTFLQILFVDDISWGHVSSFECGNLLAAGECDADTRGESCGYIL
jgi:hypothetical protein